MATDQSRTIVLRTSPVTMLFIGALAVLIFSILAMLCLALWVPDATRLDAEAIKHFQRKNPDNSKEWIWRAALLWREIFLGPNHPDVAHNLRSLAIYFRNQGQSDQAELHFKHAVSILESCYTTTTSTSALRELDLANLLDAVSDLAELYIRAGNFEKASSTLKQWKQIAYGKSLHEGSVLRWQRLHRALVRRGSSKYALAPPRGNTSDWYNVIADYRKTIARVHEMTAPEKRHRYALNDFVVTLSDAAHLCMQTGNLAEARKILIAVMQLEKQDPAFFNLATDFEMLAMICEAENNLGQADNCFKKALLIQANDSRYNPACRAATLDNYASLLQKLGRQDESNKLEQQAEGLRKANTNGQ